MTDVHKIFNLYKPAKVKPDEEKHGFYFEFHFYDTLHPKYIMYFYWHNKLLK